MTQPHANRFISAALSVLLGAVALGLGPALAQQDPAPPALAIVAPPGFVGSESCGGCHSEQMRAWRGSQHARAMQVADEQTVLGDFGDARAEHYGSKARFWREDGKFVVTTEGRDGKERTFTVAYTFGLEPLQQYLVVLEDGRVQALPFAWDTRPKAAGGRGWFHLYPDEAIPPADPLHWTGAQQNWNFMCAECHSTAVRKNYDPARNRYATSFSEVAIGCEGCHGPAGGHVAWAAGGRAPEVPHKGFPSVTATRPAADWTPSGQTGSPANSVTRPPGDEVEMCGRCHARRGQFSEAWAPGRPLADTHLPVFLTPELFHDDGQMKDEVFNYASFLQSKMHAKGVTCGDCHEPHTGKLRAEGTAVCGQCHLTERFASTAHTGHKPGQGAPDCLSCHMPASTYMVVDPRRDHSFRVPRPDLSVRIGVPNACSSCHGDKSAAWAAAAVETWHGTERKGAQGRYAEAFHAARTGAPEARERLLAVARDQTLPAIARATALVNLGARPSAAVEQEMAKALADPDAMVRIAALRGLAALPPDLRWQRGNALLSDPVRAVRMEAALALAEQRSEALAAPDRERFERAIAEYLAGQRFDADRAESRSNIAGFLLRRGRPAEAEAEYRAGMRLQPAMTALHVNLADLYRRQGKDREAEQLLRSALTLTPSAAAPRHALGLALVRQRRHGEALEHLARAAELAPDQPRFGYVYAVALQSAGRPAEARGILEATLRRHPSDVEVLNALLQGSLQARDFRQALAYAERLQILLPEEPAVARLLGQLRSRP